MNILDLVLTTKEASLKYPIADCTIRGWILDGEFNKEDFKKSGNTWIIKKSSIEEILTKKGLLNKRIKLESKNYNLSHLGYKNKKIEVWFEEECTYKMFKNMPYNETILTLLDIYKKENKLPFKTVIIVNNNEKSDNSLFKKEKTWLLTSKALYQILKEALDEKKTDMPEINMCELENYFKLFDN